MDIHTLIYIPSEGDKTIISALCSHIIDTLEPLNIQQKAFALSQLITSFEEVSGIKFDAILTHYRDEE